MNRDSQMFTVDLGGDISKLMTTMECGKYCDGKKLRIHRNRGEGVQPSLRKVGQVSWT